MALINCPECGKEISDKASVCIYCGYKKSFPKRTFNCIRKHPNISGIIIITLLCAFLYVLSMEGIFANEKQKEAIKGWERAHEENKKTMDEIDEFLEKYDFDN